MDAMEKEVIKIVRRIAGNRCHIDGNTRLYQDLGIAGDDMSELLILIYKNFGTSFQDMLFERYCPDEVDAFYDFILRKVGLGSKWTPLTVAHLTQVVKSGSWFDP